MHICFLFLIINQHKQTGLKMKNNKINLAKSPQEAGLMFKYENGILVKADVIVYISEDDTSFLFYEVKNNKNSYIVDKKDFPYLSYYYSMGKKLEICFYQLTNKG